MTRHELGEPDPAPMYPSDPPAGSLAGALAELKAALVDAGHAIRAEARVTWARWRR